MEFSKLSKAEKTQITKRKNGTVARPTAEQGIKFGSVYRKEIRIKWLINERNYTIR